MNEYLNSWLTDWLTNWLSNWANYWMTAQLTNELTREFHGLILTNVIFPMLVKNFPDLMEPQVHYYVRKSLRLQNFLHPACTFSPYSLHAPSIPFVLICWESNIMNLHIMHSTFMNVIKCQCDCISIAYFRCTNFIPKSCSVTLVSDYLKFVCRKTSDLKKNTLNISFM